MHRFKDTYKKISRVSDKSTVIFVVLKLLSKKKKKKGVDITS